MTFKQSCLVESIADSGYIESGWINLLLNNTNKKMSLSMLGNVFPYNAVTEMLIWLLRMKIRWLCSLITSIIGFLQSMGPEGLGIKWFIIFIDNLRHNKSINIKRSINKTYKKLFYNN